MKSVLLFLKQILSKTNKYVITGVIFLIITFIIGDSTLFHHYEYAKQIRELEDKVVKCKEEGEENKKKLEMLKSDNESLERFARERYLMTKPGEELFVINE